MDEPLTGDRLLAILAALGNPQRLRIVAALAGRRQYVSQLARELGISRPLLHMHLQRLEAAGLISADLELSESGKAVKYVEATAFALRLTPADVAAAVPTLTESRGDGAGPSAR
ncbi:transcriptional regulator [Pilimelia anulata]|uniref:Transcriptional regulator n=1 Tax=Pilimelia anulata TaxID=53371 RepID=A0A8J3F872_9ACTN|nr:winged helix-turn-helix domain-containing protein [Pilimelia anulata]GGJ83796.1 transcriptional regulator [Pilimelia anulata]